MPAIGLDVKEWLLEVGREISIDAIDKEFGEAEDRIHGSPELVAHAGQEVRFRLARPFEPFIECPELLRGLPLLLIETVELVSHLVHVGDQRAELIPIRDVDGRAEISGRHPAEKRVRFPHGEDE